MLTLLLKMWEQFWILWEQFQESTTKVGVGRYSTMQVMSHHITNIIIITLKILKALRTDTSNRKPAENSFHYEQKERTIIENNWM